jgi:hypothetical protein
MPARSTTIAMAYGGQHPGCPVVGDNVYLGPGSRVIDRWTHARERRLHRRQRDRHPIRAEVKSLKGSSAYVIYTDYPAEPFRHDMTRGTVAPSGGAHATPIHKLTGFDECTRMTAVLVLQQ